MRVVLSCIFAVSLFSCKITSDEPDTFTVTFDANGGSGSIESITKTENEEFELPANTFTKNGFTFAGWNTKQTPDETSKSYKDKEKITLTEDLTLYAQWEEISYKINYELNGGTNAKENPATFKKTDNVALTEPTYEYFDFCGWYLTQDFSDEAITGWNVGEKTSDITLYAKWTVKAENVVNAIKNLTERTHIVCVVGEIDETTVKNIGEALRSNKNAKVNLDLSETTGLESIPEFAFFNCSNLMSIKLPYSIYGVGPYSFSTCISLSKLELPESVTSIERSAFEFCTSLTNIKIPKNVKYIDYCAFDSCINLINIDLPEGGITSIESYSFANCICLENIRISISVTDICDTAFYGCSSLTSITYLGTMEQWKSVSIEINGLPYGKNNFYSAKIICTDGIINE